MNSTTKLAVSGDRDNLMPAASYSSLQKSPIPRIPLDLREHKKPLAITAAVTLSTGCFLPIAMYYILRDGAHTTETVAITVASLIFGVYSIFSVVTRTYSLLRKSSTSRPIGATKRHLDYFHWNFLTIFVLMTVMIAAGSSLAGSENPTIAKAALRIFSMALSVIISIVCIQLVVISLVMSCAPNMRYPMRISSMTKRDIVRPALYTIIEDVVAVDGKQGTTFRMIFNERYQYSKDIRGLLRWADAVWGFTGLSVAAGLFCTIWIVDNVNIGFVLGWTVPWIWAGTFTSITIKKTQSVLKKEGMHYPG